MQLISTPHRIASKIALLLLIGVGLLILWWWINRTIYTSPNLLPNPDFEAELSGWEIFKAEGTVDLRPAVDDANHTVLAMSIPRSDLETWVAIKTKIDDIVPLQGYSLTTNYRLPHQGRSSAKVVLRVVQFDQAGQLITQDEISDPNPLVTTLDDKGQPAWSSLTHSFVVDERAETIEIYIALFGNQATVVEIDQPTFVLETNSSWLNKVGAGIIVLLIFLFLVVLANYARRWDFARSSTKLAQKWAAVVVVNLVVFLILAELMALGIYFFREGGLFYTRQKKYELIGVIAETEEASNELSDNLTSRRFHPFFGFVVKPGIDRRFNNYGFISPYDYPYLKKSENEYLIGIFGGSVAEIFSQNENRDRFIQKLKRNDFFKDKEIVILNFAAGAYKQPQQLLVLNYFLSIGQDFDMVINIDGFNEASMSYINYQDGVDISMPVSYIMLPLANLTNQTTPSPKTIESLAKINRYRTSLNNLAQKINNNHIAFVGFILEQYYAFLLNKYRAELATLEQIKSDTFTSLIHINPGEQKLDEDILFERIAQNWANSSIIMNDVLTRRGISYFHFLQPNQYYSKKRFTDEEARIALNPDQISKVGVEKIYPILAEKAATLRENGVNFYSGLDIFDDELEAVYGDDCCHYNALGNEILANFIARTILEE